MESIRFYSLEDSDKKIKHYYGSGLYNQLKGFLILFFVFCPFFSISSGERYAELSCSKQSLHVLPGVVLKELEQVEQIIFLHIPKTAGTNLDNIAKAVSRNDGKFYYQRLSVPRVPGRSPGLITPGWVGGRKQLEINPHLLDAVPQTFFLAGHFPYGLHLHFSRPSKYVTLVRNPIERDLSSANFDYQRGYIEAEGFEEYLMEQMIDNPQVRLIAGMEYMSGPCTEQTLEKAKENIERDFLLAAPSEDVDSFIEILASIQGWGSIAYAPMQITREKVVEHPTPFLEEALLEKHKWDLKLYQWVKMRWNLWKDQVILSRKVLSPEEQVLTLMPDFLTTRQAVSLSVSEIDSYNQKHEDCGLLENKQKM